MATLRGNSCAGAKQAGKDLSREISCARRRTCASSSFQLLRAGIKVNDQSDDLLSGFQHVELMRFDGKRWCGSGIMLYGE